MKISSAVVITVWIIRLTWRVTENINLSRVNKWKHLKKQENLTSCVGSKKIKSCIEKIHSIILCAHEPQPTGIIGWCILFMYIMYVSPGVESNQNNVTCFDLIRSHQTHLLVKTLESNAWSHWMDSRVSSTDNSSLVAQLKISETSEKTEKAYTIYTYGIYG